MNRVVLKQKKKDLNWIDPVSKISFLWCEKSLRNFKNSFHSCQKNLKIKNKFLKKKKRSLEIK